MFSKHNRGIIILVIIIMALVLCVPLLFWGVQVRSKADGRKMVERYSELSRVEPVPDGYDIPLFIGTDTISSFALDGRVYVSAWNIYNKEDYVPSDTFAYSIIENERYLLVARIEGQDPEKMVWTFIEDRGHTGDKYNEALIYLEYEYFLNTEGVIWFTKESMLYDRTYYVLADDPLRFELPEGYVLEDYVDETMANEFGFLLGFEFYMHPLFHDYYVRIDEDTAEMQYGAPKGKGGYYLHFEASGLGI